MLYIRSPTQSIWISEFHSTSIDIPGFCYQMSSFASASRVSVASFLAIFVLLKAHGDMAAMFYAPTPGSGAAWSGVASHKNIAHHDNPEFSWDLVPILVLARSHVQSLTRSSIVAYSWKKTWLAWMFSGPPVRSSHCTYTSCHILGGWGRYCCYQNDDSVTIRMLRGF